MWLCIGVLSMNNMQRFVAFQMTPSVCLFNRSECVFLPPALEKTVTAEDINLCQTVVLWLQRDQKQDATGNMFL